MADISIPRGIKRFLGKARLNEADNMTVAVAFMTRPERAFQCV